MSKDANSLGHDKALAWESRGFVYTKKRMHRFDTPSGVRGRKTKVGKNYFVFLLLDFVRTYFLSYEKNVFLCMITL